MDIGAALALAASLWLTLPHGETTPDLLETMVPFVFTDAMNTGGVLTATPQLLGSDGSSWTQTTYTIGLLDVTDVTHGGMPFVYPDLSLLEQVHVTTRGAPVDVRAPGPSVGLMSRRGSDTWRGEAGIAGSPAVLASDGPSAPPPLYRLRSLAHVEVTAGGPLRSSATQLFAAGSVTRSTHLERNDGTVLPGNASSVFAHLTAKTGTAHDWAVMGWVQQLARPFDARVRLADPNVREHDRLLGVISRWQTSARWPIRIEAGAQSGSLSTDATVESQHGTIERLRDAPVQELVLRMPGTRARLEAAAEVAPNAIGRHTIRFGASAWTAHMTASGVGSGPIGETVGGLPARAWSYSFTSGDQRHQAAVSGYVSDRIALTERAWIDVGVRADHVTGSNAGSRISWSTLAPRVAVFYSPGTWQFMGTARQYYDQLTLDVLAFGDPSAPSGDVYRWTDANGDGRVQQGELGAAIARVGPGSAGGNLSSIDPELRAPHVDEALLGIGRTLGAHWTVQFSGVSRTRHDRLAALDVGVPVSAYTVGYVFDPGLDLGGSGDDQMLPVYSRPPATFGADRYLLTNLDSVAGTYGGLYLTIASRGYDRWHLLVGGTALRTNAPAAYRGFTAAENDDAIVGDAFSDPNSTTYAIGRTLFDRSFGLKVAGSYEGPRGLTLGTVARYADGQNFARLVLFPDLPQGPDVVRAYKNGLSKFTYTLTVDLRAAKAFSVSGHRVAVTLDAFNLLNTHNEVEEDVLTGPGFRAATAVQPPRVIRIGVSAGF